MDRAQKGCACILPGWQEMTWGMGSGRSGPCTEGLCVFSAWLACDAVVLWTGLRRAVRVLCLAGK